MRFPCIVKPCHWRRENITRQISLDTAAPALAVPALLSIASFSPAYTVVTFLISPAVIYYIHRNFLRFLPRSKFFFAWAISSLVSLMLVFELCVVPLLEILPEENAIFFALVVAGFSCGCMVRLRAEQRAEELNESSEEACSLCRRCAPPTASHCRLCQMCVQGREYHCSWLDCCVGTINLHWYLYCLLCTAAALIYGSNLAMTTVCHPYALFWTILLPDDCTDVYYLFETALAFVSSIYSLIVGTVFSANLLYHLWKIFKKSYWSKPRNQEQIDDQAEDALFRVS